MNAEFPAALFRTILRLYPGAFRHGRGQQLERLYRQMWDDLAPAGLTGAVAFQARLCLDLLWNVPAAWGRHLLGRRNGGLRQDRGGAGLAGASLGELKVAVRRLSKSPGFTLVAVLTLALGIAANTVVFALIHGVYLKPLPFPEPDRLVYLQETDGRLRLSTSHEAFEYFRDQTTSFEAFGAYGGAMTVLRDREDPIRLNAAMVSADLFSLLGVAPAQGRGFFPEEDDPGSEGVVILSHATWQNFFGGRPEVVGEGVRMGSGTFTVVGIMPLEFRFPSERVQCWFSLRGMVREPTYRSLTMVGRLGPESSPESAAEEVMAVGRRLEEENDPAKGGEFTYLYPLKDRLVGSRFQATFAALAVAVGFLLLIAGANLTNLLLARASTRKVEIAVRTALGASGFRVALTGLAEPVILAMASGVVGIVGAFWGTRLVLRLAPAAIPRQAEIGLDPWVLVFALIVSLAAGVFIGLTSLPRHRGAGLTIGTHSGGRVSRDRPLQSVFTVVQVALTFALLAGVSLMARTVENLQAVDVGFDPAEAYEVLLGLPGARFPDAPSRLAFHDQVVERALGLPGVSAAGYTTFLPLGGGWNDRQALVEGTEASAEELPRFEYDLATPGFFEAMGISLRQGRLLDEGDREGSLLVAVVNETAAQLHFPDGEALGRRFSVGTEEEPVWLTVVGVVEDVRHHSITETATPKFYLPFPQFPEPWPYGLNLVIRTDGPEPQAAVGMIRSMIRDLDAGGPLVEIYPLQARVDRRIAGPRFNALLLGLFTVAALALASLGLYGMLSFGVAERRKEIGLRMALGADRLRVRSETLWDGLRLTLTGILIGVPLALGMGRVMASMLFGVGTYESVVLVLVSVLLGGVSILACLLPSFRASRIDPMVSLRIE